MLPFFFTIQLFAFDKNLDVTIAIFESDSFSISGNFDLLSKTQSFSNCSHSNSDEIILNTKLDTHQKLGQFSNNKFSLNSSQINYLFADSGIASLFIDNEYSELSFPILIEPQNSLKINNLETSLNILVHIKEDKFIGTIQLSFDEYISRVVQKELGENYPKEAIITQCIISRTKALNQLMRKTNPYYDFWGTTKFQAVDLTNDVSLFIDVYRNLCDSKVILYNSKIIDAVFSSCCGGITEKNQDIWSGNPIPYLQSINQNSNITFKENGYCKSNEESSNWEKSKYRWEVVLANSISSKIAKEIGRYYKYKIVKKSNSGRVTKIKLIGSKRSKIIEGEYNIRKYFGYLPSSKIKSITNNDKFIIFGSGYGHGVGLCQIGMINLARDGQSPEDIISYYYKGVEVVKIEIIE